MKVHYNQIPKKNKNLLILRPNLCIEWSTKNELGPENYKLCSNKRVWWCCIQCNYEWESIIANRTLQNTKCPSCRKTKQVLTDKNRLSILYPDIAQEWDFSKNSDLPSQVSFGSNKKRWWICSKCQSSWLAIVANRTVSGRGCRKCRSSHGEKEIESYLLNKNIKYQREYKIPECRNDKVLSFDFAIWTPSLKLIEYNGIQHYEPQEYWGGLEKLERTKHTDKIKSDFCKKNDIPLHIIHYKNFCEISEILDKFIN